MKNNNSFLTFYLNSMMGRESTFLLIITWVLSPILLLVAYFAINLMFKAIDKNLGNEVLNQKAIVIDKKFIKRHLSGKILVPNRWFLKLKVVSKNAKKSVSQKFFNATEIDQEVTVNYRVGKFTSDIYVTKIE